MGRAAALARLKRRPEHKKSLIKTLGDAAHRTLKRMRPSSNCRPQQKPTKHSSKMTARDYDRIHDADQKRQRRSDKLRARGSLGGKHA